LQPPHTIACVQPPCRASAFFAAHELEAVFITEAFEFVERGRHRTRGGNDARAFLVARKR